MTSAVAPTVIQPPRISGSRKSTLCMYGGVKFGNLSMSSQTPSTNAGMVSFFSHHYIHVKRCCLLCLSYIIISFIYIISYGVNVCFCFFIVLFKQQLKVLLYFAVKKKRKRKKFYYVFEEEAIW